MKISINIDGPAVSSNDSCVALLSLLDPRRTALGFYPHPYKRTHREAR